MHHDVSCYPRSHDYEDIRYSLFIVLRVINEWRQQDRYGGKSNNGPLPQYWLWFVWGLGLSNGPILNSAILLNAENAGTILVPAAAVV